MSLVTINDLDTEGWQQHLRQIELLGDWYDELKRVENEDVSFNVFIGAEKARLPGVHASEVSGCMKRFVYTLMNIERKLLPDQVNVNMKRRFNVGTCLHSLIQNEMARMLLRFGGGYMEFVDEVKITPETNDFTKKYHVNSSADGLFTFYDANFVPSIRLGLEIKTESDKEYEKLKAPRQSHIEQAHIYMRALDIPVFWFLYYNKSSSLWTPPTAPWLITYDKRTEKQLETRIRSAYTMAEHGNLPAAEEGLPCSWCPFAYDCKPTFLLTSRANRPSSARLTL